MKGIIVKSTGSWYLVKTQNSIIIECRIVGKLKLDDKKLTNPIAVGDYVEFDLEPDSTSKGIIRQIAPRRNYVVRQSPRKRHQLHLLSSNIDQALLIVTMKEPNLKLGFIDRFLIMTEPYSIPVIIVFNKYDLYTPDDRVYYCTLKKLYTKIGYKVMFTSTVTHEGIDTLSYLLKGQTTMIAGQSGVGKSTLINCIEPTLNLKTEEISDFSGKGQHTTTFAQMYDLSLGGSIIDTPGIKSLTFSHLGVMDVAHNYKEFFLLSEGCKFSDCTHINEPGCAIRKAVEKGTISNLRYQSYISLIEEIEEQNYWERHNDV